MYLNVSVMGRNKYCGGCRDAKCPKYNCNVKTMNSNSNKKCLTKLSWRDMYEALDSVTRRVLIHYTATLTCSPSGWWQSWLRPSGYHSPVAVEWSGFPAAPSSAGTIQQQQQQQKDSVTVQPWEESQMVWVPSCLSTLSVVIKKTKLETENSSL